MKFFNSEKNHFFKVQAFSKDRGQLVQLGVLPIKNKVDTFYMHLVRFPK